MEVKHHRLAEEPIVTEIKVLREELLTEATGPAAQMNSQHSRVNDYRALSRAVIDLRLAWLYVFIDAIVYLFGAQRPHFTLTCCGAG